MTSEYKAENEASTESSVCESSGSSEDASLDFLNSLIQTKKNEKSKKSKSRSHHFGSTFPANPQQSMQSPAMYPPYYPYPPSFQQNPYQSQIEELHQTLLKQIEYNKKREKKRKKKKIVQKQQNSAAKKIQKAWKKYRVVANWTDPLMTQGIEQLLTCNELANEYLDDLIREYFLTEFVPDLLIDILSNENEDEFYQKDVVTKVTWSFYEEIEKEVCTSICRQLCNETIDEIVSQYFDQNKGGLHLKGILHHINNETVNDVVLTETKNVVEECIEELIIEYLIQNKSIELFNDLLPDIIENIVNETVILHILQTDTMDKILMSGFLDQMIREVATEEYEKHKKQILAEKNAKEHDLIESCLIEHLLNDELLNIFFSKLSSRCQKSFVNDQAIKLLIHSEMSSILIKKHVNLYTVHQRTKQNAIVNEQLMSLLCDTAITPFLDFLKQ